MRREREKIYIVHGHQQEGTDLMMIRTMKMVMMITVRMMTMTMVMAMMALVITMTIYIYSEYDIYIIKCVSVTKNDHFPLPS